MVVIYTVEDTPRLRYIAGIILGDILGLQWNITTDKRKVGKNPVINYSGSKILHSFKIIPDKILFEKGVELKEITITQWRGLPVFFQTPADSDLPFDIFAASFFLVSRYEEYLKFEPDEFGRFPSASSIAFKNDFLQKPIIEMWARELANAILHVFPMLVFKKNKYKSLLTIDTDEPFAFSGKNIFKSIGGFFKEKRSRAASNTDKDPYDVFDYIIDSIQKTGIESQFFFPVGDHSKYDKNPSWKSEHYRNLILKIAGKYKFGLHPSFKAGGDGTLINNEAARLKSIIGKDIDSSRFHYLRLSMPRSYSNSINAGISEDYSMGYHDEPGFRAGISRPFNFYNVFDDLETNLKIVPFQVMDATLREYKKLDPDGSKELILKLINETKKVGGVFVSIWHNTSLLENAEGKCWREVFEFTIKNQ